MSAPNVAGPIPFNRPGKKSKENGAQQIIYEGLEEGDENPAIEVTPGALGEIVDRAMRILVGCEVNIFQRGHKLVRPIIGQSVDSKGKPVLFPALMEVERPFLRMSLCRHIDWYKPDARCKTGSNIFGVKAVMS